MKKGKRFLITGSLPGITGKRDQSITWQNDEGTQENRGFGGISLKVEKPVDIRKKVI